MSMSMAEAIEVLSTDEKRCGAAVLDLQVEACNSGDRYAIFSAAMVETSAETIMEHGEPVIPMVVMSAFFMGFWCCQLMHCDLVAPYPKDFAVQPGGVA